MQAGDEWRFNENRSDEGRGSAVSPEEAKRADLASRRAIFAYALTDFLRRIGTSCDETGVERLMRLARSREAEDPELEWLGPDTVKLTSHAWRALWPLFEHDLSEKSTNRAWERWKDGMVAERIGRRVGPSSYWFSFDVTKAQRWAEKTIKLGIRLAEAYEKATGRKLAVLRAPETEIDRTLTAADLARELGVEIHALYEWIRRGLPHSRQPGTRGFGTLLFNLNEARAWLAGQIDESRRIASHHEERIASTEASPRLLAARDTLGLSTEALAEKLNVSPGTLNGWLFGRSDTVPLKAVIEAEELLVERGIDPTEARSGPLIERLSREEAAPRLRAAMKTLNVSNAKFADLLEVPTVTLKSWLGTGGKVASTVPKWAVDRAEELSRTLEPRVYRSMSSRISDPAAVRTAFERAHGSASAAARILGVAKSTAAAAAERLGIRMKERTVLSETISADELRAVLVKHGGNATTAASDLGIDRTSTVRLAEAYGIGELVRRRAR